MTQHISCPKCTHEFEVSAAIESQIRNQMDADYAQRKAELETQKQAIQKTVADRINSERDQLIADARKTAQHDLQTELRANEAQITNLNSDLHKAKAKELEILRREQELTTKMADAELETARAIAAERKTIEEAAQARVAEQYRMNDLSKDKKITEMRNTILDLQRQAEQTSQQTQGDVAEVDLEHNLCRQFPTDRITPVSTGVNGADIRQVVITPTGQPCGEILWESKNTKNWSNDWLAKLRDDQRRTNANFAIIVSRVLPKGVTTMKLEEGVWICSRDCAAGLAHALRVSLLRIASLKTASEGKQEKMALVYRYLSGENFAQRISGIVEAFQAMRADLESEKRAYKKHWSKRERQLERAAENAAGLHGDLEGIIGAALPLIDGLHAIEGDDGAAESLPAPHELKISPKRPQAS